MVRRKLRRVVVPQTVHIQAAARAKQSGGNCSAVLPSSGTPPEKYVLHWVYIFRGQAHTYRSARRLTRPDGTAQVPACHCTTADSCTNRARAASVLPPPAHTNAAQQLHRPVSACRFQHRGAYLKLHAPCYIKNHPRRREYESAAHAWGRAAR